MSAAREPSWRRDEDGRTEVAWGGVDPVGGQGERPRAGQANRPQRGVRRRSLDRRPVQVVERIAVASRSYAFPKKQKIRRRRRGCGLVVRRLLSAPAQRLSAPSGAKLSIPSGCPQIPSLPPPDDDEHFGGRGDRCASRLRGRPTSGSLPTVAVIHVRHRPIETATRGRADGRLLSQAGTWPGGGGSAQCPTRQAIYVGAWACGCSSSSGGGASLRTEVQ